MDHQSLLKKITGIGVALLFVTGCATPLATTPSTQDTSRTPQPSPTLEATVTRTPPPTSTPIVVEGVGRTVATIRLPNQGALFPAVGAGSIWVPGPGLLARIDPATLQVVAEITLDEGKRGDPPYAVTVEGDAIWATERVGKAIVRIDPNTNEIMERIPLGVDGELHAIALDGDTLWVAVRGDNMILRVDTQTKQVIANIPVDDPTSIAIGAEAIWVVEHHKGNLVRIDPNTNSVVATIQVGYPGQVALGEGSVWVGDLAGAVSRVDPQTNQEVARIDLGIPVGSVEVGAGAVWAMVAEFEGCANSGVIRIDPRTNTPVGRIPVRCPGDMAVNTDGLWVNSYQYPEITLIIPEE